MNYYENVFDHDDLEEIWQSHLSKPQWQFWHTSVENSDNCHWLMDLNNNTFFTQNLFEKLKSLIGEYNLDSVYANGQTYGLNGDIHVDSQNENYHTFLYYPMMHWDLNWGGETVIIRPEGVIETIYPKPNTGVLFSSNWAHFGKSPSRHCKDLRVTIAFKLYQ